MKVRGQLPKQLHQLQHVLIAVRVPPRVFLVLFRSQTVLVVLRDHGHPLDLMNVLRVALALGHLA